MARPRLFLVCEFTELQWAIKPQLEEWADVVSYDLPGVGTEPGRAHRADFTYGGHVFHNWKPMGPMNLVQSTSILRFYAPAVPSSHWKRFVWPAST